MTEEKKKTPNIAITPVESSSNVAGYGYDLVTGTLAVKFKGGSVYHYSGVPGKVIDELREAKSFGSFISSRIVKGGFNCTKAE